MDWLVRHNRFRIGKVFPEHARDSFRDTIVRGLDGGLGRKAIGKRLRDLMAGTRDPPGKIELYNRVAAASTRGNHSQLSAHALAAFFWTLGRYARPWFPERPVFGRVRFMSSVNTARKMRVNAHIEKYGSATCSSLLSEESEIG